MLSAIAAPAVLLAPSGEVRTANASFLMLASSRGPRVSDGFVGWDEPACAKAWQAGLARAAERARSGRIGWTERLDVCGFRAVLLPLVDAGSLLAVLEASHDEDRLTPMQRRVADELVTGCTIAEAAEALGIAPETVRTHLKEVYRRLGISTRAELARALR